MASSSDAFLAHPDEPLVDHLIQVGMSCRKRMQELNVSDQMCVVAELIGKTHDFGKYNEFFQKHIRSPEIRGKEISSHAPLSAAYAVYAIHRITNDKTLSLIGSFSVWYHHRSLDKSLFSFAKELLEFPDNPNYQKQLGSLKSNADRIQSELDTLQLPPLNEFLDFVEGDDFKDLIKDIYNSVPLRADFQSFYNLLLLFSVLIDADKKFSAGILPNQSRAMDEDEVLNRLTNRVSQLGGRQPRIDPLRKAVRESVLKELDDLLSRPNIPKLMYLHAPTGIGKTLLAFECALRLRKEVMRRTGKQLRIVYVLPFINIIEQTYDTVSKLVQDGNIIEHHHLYVPAIKNDDESVERMMMLTEAWDSEIIVTTFVQLIETLIGTKNRMLKKFNKIFDSIIVLDEVQALRPELWRLVKDALESLPEGSYTIIMSATIPGIFRELGKPLLQDPSKFYQQMNRVRYQYLDHDFEVEDLAKFVKEKWNGKSMLIVVNTINSSIALYRSLKGLFKQHTPLLINNSPPNLQACEGPYLAYLSTNIVPSERRGRINALNSMLKDSKSFILVSTQVVEAGVDLDFQTVIREIAPLDSIVQAGGRCNRNWNNELGDVYIIRLKYNNQYNWKHVYSSLSIESTEQLLRQNPVIEEKDFYEKITGYYERKEMVERLRDATESLDFIDAIERLDFTKLSEFKLIEQEPMGSVFVNLNQDADLRLKELKKVWYQIQNGDRNYSLRNKLKMEWRRAQKYIIDTRHLDKLPMEKVIPSDDNVRLIDGNQLNDYYDFETGLKIGESSDAYIFP